MAVLLAEMRSRVDVSDIILIQVYVLTVGSFDQNYTRCILVNCGDSS